jgi:hypothetical protein
MKSWILITIGSYNKDLAEVPAAELEMWLQLQKKETLERIAKALIGVIKAIPETKTEERREG